MTAIAITHRNHRGSPIIPLLVIVFAVLAIPTLVASAHASLHTEANQIRACAADPVNLNQVWLNKSGDRLNCLINLPGGKVGDQVIQWSCRQLKWLEITSYIIGDGSLSEAIRVLEEKGCTKVWPPI